MIYSRAKVGTGLGQRLSLWKGKEEGASWGEARRGGSARAHWGPVEGGPNNLTTTELRMSQHSLK